MVQTNILWHKHDFVLIFVEILSKTHAPYIKSESIIFFTFAFVEMAATMFWSDQDGLIDFRRNLLVVTSPSRTYSSRINHCAVPAKN